MAKNTPPTPFDAAKLRHDFPAINRSVNGHPFCFLDSAASAQKPNMVIDSVRDTWSTTYANIHRGLYESSRISTTGYETARAKIADFIGADTNEIIFTRNATESINLIAQTWGKANLGDGDEIIITELEHHANIVPWQIICEQTGATLIITPIDDDGQVDLDAYYDRLNSNTKLVSILAMSNALGSILPVKKMISAAQDIGAKTLIDGCQSVVHGKTDVRDLNCDFYVFSGHKLYGPDGIGVCYGKYDVLADMPPYQSGGDMIDHVSFDHTTYGDPPSRFEAGTPAIAQAIALGAAVDYLNDIDLNAAADHEIALRQYAEERMTEITGLNIIGTAADKGPIISFTMDNAHPQDIATLLDKYGVAVRVGHHCCEPLMNKLGIDGTIRASIGLYNTKTDIDQMITGVNKIKDML